MWKIRVEVPGEGKCQSGGSQSNPGGGQSPAGVGNQVQVVVKLTSVLKNMAVRQVTLQKVSFDGGVYGLTLLTCVLLYVIVGFRFECGVSMC